MNMPGFYLCLACAAKYSKFLRKTSSFISLLLLFLYWSAMGNWGGGGREGEGIKADLELCLCCASLVRNVRQSGASLISNA